MELGVRTVVGGLLGACVVMVAGCAADSSGASDDADPASPTTMSRTPSPSAGESTWEPPSPAKPPKGGWPEDQPATEISAEKVVRLWIKAYSRATLTGDTSRMRRIGAPKCAECAQYADEIEEDFRAGDELTFRGAPYKPGTVTYVDAEAPPIELRMVVHSAAGRRKEVGKQPVGFKAVDYEWFFVLVTDRDHRWRIKQTGFMG